MPLSQSEDARRLPAGVLLAEPSEWEGVDAAEDVKARWRRLFEGPPSETQTVTNGEPAPNGEAPS